MAGSLKLRQYQEDIVREARDQNALFLVPTIDLVEQQASALETWMNDGKAVARYHGSVSISDFDRHVVLVTTPQAFLGLQSSNSNQGLFDFNVFDICIFDEVHHVLKDHPYRKISLRLKSIRATQQDEGPKVVGLSASLTYAMCEKSVKKALDNLCYDLSITKMCSPTKEELLAGGYTPREGNVEMCDMHDIPEGVLPQWERSPHEMHKTFMMRVRERKSTPFSLLIWDTIQLLEKQAENENCFESPLAKPKLSAWEEHACKLKKRYPGPPHFYQLLEDWYVALRLLVVTWEEEEPLVMRWLLTRDALEVQANFGATLSSNMQEVKQLATNSLNYIKLNALREQIREKKEEFGVSFRCIVFVQQRISAFVVAQFINEDAQLKQFSL
eukprot:scaffold50613_cov47-Attheya_sp.AAC.1